MKELVEELQQKLKSQEQNKYQQQSRQIENILSDVDELYHNLEQLGCFLAGGAITSVFTNKEVNDLDIYFRNIDDLKVFLLSAFGQFEDSDYTYDERYEEVVDLSSHELICIGYTKKSIMFRTKNSAQDIQLIHCDFYETPEDIFNTFDYTINMGVYDFKEGMFVLYEDFLVDNACRKLTVNPNTAFPIISQLRIDKYKQRGYSINRKEFIKLSLAVANLNLQSWDDVKEAIGGMYGYTMEELFDEEKEFSFEELFKQIELLEYKLENQKPYETVENVDKLIDILEMQHEPVVKGKSYFYYKKVKSTGNPTVFESYHNSSFKYTLGDYVQDESHGVYLYKSRVKAERHVGGDTVIKLSSPERLVLESDWGNGKFRTKGKVKVVEVVTTDVEQPENIPY